MLKYCGAALCALICVLLLKNHKGELAALVVVAASTIFISAAVMELMPAFDFLSEAMTNTGLDGYFSTLLKAMGITAAVQFTSEICKDAGEGAIASKLEFVGKAEIVILCLPLIKEIISLATEIIDT